MKRRGSIALWIAALVSALAVGAVQIGNNLSRAEAASPSLSPDTLASLFRSANEHYASGDFEGAMKIYLDLAERGVREADLFYNLGNACYRNGDIGRAVLYYEKALRLDPRDQDTRKNLALVGALLRDKQFVAKDSWFERPYKALERNLSSGEALAVASVLYVFLCLLLAGYIFLDSRPVAVLHRLYYRVSPGRLLGLSPKGDYISVVVAALVLLLLFGSIGVRESLEARSGRAAVVLAKEVAVYSEPSQDSTLQFKVHEGTLVSVVERRRGWTRIRLPGGLSGWVEPGAIGRI